MLDRGPHRRNARWRGTVAGVRSDGEYYQQCIYLLAGRTGVQMKGVLWYVLASSRGGQTRVRILRELADRPQNANQLSRALDLDYTTIRHHLDVFLDNNVLERSGDDYGAVYLFTDQVEAHWDVVEEILDAVDPEER